jgi:superfamily II DNA or RNA helicase
VVDEPFGEFMAEVQRLAREMPFTAPGRVAQRYLKAFTERREVLGSARAKYDAVKQLAPSLRNARGSIVFTATIEAAEHIAAILRAQGIRAEATHSEVASVDRARQLERFRQRTLATLVAPTVLDEGVDVPDADLAIITAASSSRRQMIQRMGRILRRKPDGRAAQMVILFVEDSPEDPARGAHEAFLDEVTSVADKCSIFSSRHTHHAVESLTSGSTMSSPPVPHAPERVEQPCCPHCSKLVSLKPGRHTVGAGALWHNACWLAAQVPR